MWSGSKWHDVCVCAGEAGRRECCGGGTWSQTEGQTLREAVGHQVKGRNQCYRYDSNHSVLLTRVRSQRDLCYCLLCRSIF